MATFCFLCSLFFIGYTWIGYYAFIIVLAQFFKKNTNYLDENSGYEPFVSILISAYNEETVIEKRILNILSLDYPKEKIEILIGSDGSTDNTVKIAGRYSDRSVICFDFKKNRGRADVHNNLIQSARGELALFTDADTVFDNQFLRNITPPFSNKQVGAVVGRLCFLVKGGAVAKHEGFYWKIESNMRVLESRIGVVNNGTGACTAIRKSLFKPLNPVDDIDRSTISDIILEGYKVIYIKNALAYDIPPHTAEGEYKMRVRGISKTVRSYLTRMSIKDWFKKPLFTWSVLSHKIFRYISPYFMIIAFASNIAIFNNSSFYFVIFMIQIVIYFLSIIGWIANRYGKDIFIASTLFSFCLAMTGMMVGFAKAFGNNITVTYKTNDNYVDKNR